MAEKDHSRTNSIAVKLIIIVATITGLALVLSEGLRNERDPFRFALDSVMAGNGLKSGSALDSNELLIRLVL